MNRTPELEFLILALMYVNGIFLTYISYIWSEIVEIASPNNSPIHWETWMPVIISIVSFLHYYANYFLYSVSIHPLAVPTF